MPAYGSNRTFSDSVNFLLSILTWWRRSVVVSGVGLINEVNPVSTWMGDRLRAG